MLEIFLLEYPLKIGMKQTVTVIRPNIYQGLLRPMDVLNLSESIPTIGVARPSMSCPERRAAGAVWVATTLLRKKSR